MAYSAKETIKKAIREVYEKRGLKCPLTKVGYDQEKHTFLLSINIEEPGECEQFSEILHDIHWKLANHLIKKVRDGHFSCGWYMVELEMFEYEGT